MARDQYRYCGTTTKIEWKGRYHGNYEQVHKDNLTKDNNNKYIFRRNRKDLQ